MGPHAAVAAFSCRRRQCQRQSSPVAAAPPLSHGQVRHDEWSRRPRGRISCLPFQRSVFERRGRHSAKGKERGFAVSMVDRGSGHGRTRSYGAGRTLTRRHVCSRGCPSPHSSIIGRHRSLFSTDARHGRVPPANMGTRVSHVSTS
jgi:hypothetical protein